MKIFKNTIFYALIKCWKEIAISDKALIIIISILLVQCVYNLFTPEPVSSNEITICVIVRTTVASIFGYFLSENFLNHNRSQQKNSKTEITVTSDDNININDYLKISNNNNNNNTQQNVQNAKSQQEIRSIVAQAISVPEQNINFVRIKPKYEDDYAPQNNGVSLYVYKVEAKANGLEYDVVVDAVSGKVLKVKIDD